MSLLSQVQLKILHNCILHKSNSAWLALGLLNISLGNQQLPRNQVTAASFHTTNHKRKGCLRPHLSTWEPFWKNVIRPGIKVCYSTDISDDLNYEQLMSLIKSKDIQLFDVRTVEEVRQTGMMPTATNVPLSEIVEALSLAPDEFRDRYGVDKPVHADGNIVFSCLGGIRSRRALNAAQEAGFTRARHYLGGWEEYEQLVKK